jgi:pSer/pThr/pTyr-binding forkhead associated (FHA) protein
MWADGGWYIRDLGSTNGTIVNNVEVDSRMLAEGDVLTIGITNLEFRAG